MGETKRKTGRPSKQTEIDERQFQMVCQCKVRLSWVADFFKVSEDTIQRFCKDKFGQSFAQFRNKNMMPGRINLEVEARKRAMAGSDDLMKYCLAHYNGWSYDDGSDEEDPNESQVLFG